MLPGRSLVPVALGLSTFSWRTEIWEVGIRFLVAVGRWLIHRIEIAAAEAHLRANIAWSVFGLILYLFSIAGLVLAQVAFSTSLVICVLVFITWVFQVIVINSCRLQIFVCNSVATKLLGAQKQIGSAAASIALQDRSALTSHSYMDAGSFVLVARDGEWDEALLVCHNEGSEWLC